YGLGADQLETAYVSDSEDEPEQRRLDSEEQDDLEHFDSPELVGMVYEEVEPPILMASTEIRTQCLPIYYSNNAFSWRLFWLNYDRSLARVEHWAKHVASGNAKYISKLSFEGRHCIEEGVDFVMDITLVLQPPASTVEVGHLEDPVIAKMLEDTALEMLGQMVPGSAHSAHFTAEDLCKLASMFKQVMHFEPGRPEPLVMNAPGYKAVNDSDSGVSRDRPNLATLLDSIPKDMLGIAQQKLADRSEQTERLPAPALQRPGSPEL
ncbi:hypothetical protein LTR53_007808, partial [Teratosphaeriaceae sp. CCFEE 6253]